MQSTGKTAIVLGATGLVGRHLLEQLLDDPRYGEVIVLSRRPLSTQHAKLHVEIIDFDHPPADKLRGDDLFCALGTTIRKAGSQEAQYRIDCTYPFELGKLARQNGVGQYLLVSSIGADARSGNFYLRTKGELEEKLKSLEFPTLIIARPSFLLGEREEFRLGEKIGIIFARLLAPLFLGPLRKYRGIRAEQVARALIKQANSGQTGLQLLESDTLSHL